MEGRVITLVCLAFVFDFGLSMEFPGLSEPMPMDGDAPRCFIPKVELKALKPGINTHRSSSSRSQSSTFQQMKFEVWYDESVTNSSISDFIMNITRETVDLISRQLQVKEESQDIIFDRQCQTGSYVDNGTVVNCTCADYVADCGTATLPEHHLLVKINECDSDPCNNGATCSDIITGYFCTCTAEYAGRHCDYGKTICFTSNQCAKNEVCKDGLCSCGHGRIRTEEGCQIPRRFDMWFQITEVNGSLAIYPDTFKSSDEIIRGELEYAIFHRLSRWEIFVDSVFSVEIKSFNGSLGVEIDIVLDAGSTPDDVMIYDLMTDSYLFAAEDLSSGYTSYTVNVSSIVVQGKRWARALWLASLET
eukprot:XP_011670927.1 PREDICTED: uncharacterized protein LOC100892346 [Strongylocentrotus purpuratus]